MSVGGPLSANASSPLFGPIQRLWRVGDLQKSLTIDARAAVAELHLRTRDATTATSVEGDNARGGPEAGAGSQFENHTLARLVGC